MKALLFSANQYKTKIISLSDRPAGLKPEPVTNSERECRNCVVAFITFESGDNILVTSELISAEIASMAKGTGVTCAVVVPFAHLSSKLTSREDAVEGLNLVENYLGGKVETVVREHFGSHKELLLDIKGHPGAVRFREF